MTGPESDGNAPAPGDTPSPAGRRRSDYSPWNFLLIIPVVVPLLTFLFNHDQPRFIGIPMFYWLQMLFIVLGVAGTTVVYQIGKRRG